MKGPYVAFRINRASWDLLEPTITFAPPPPARFTNPFEWVIVCDSSSKVVVRALEDGKTSLRVIAIAELRGLTLVQRRQLEPSMPSLKHWELLETLVFPVRERGYALAWVPAYDDAELVELAPRALPGLPPLRDARPPRPPTWPPPVPDPQTPLWSAPKAGTPQAPRRTYLELVFDHAAVRVVDGSVRYAPDHALRPAGFYQHKLICDPAGNVTILATPDPDRDTVRIATCVWRDSALCDRKQSGGEPDDFQWLALEDALRAELSRAP